MAAYDPMYKTLFKLWKLQLRKEILGDYCRYNWYELIWETKEWERILWRFSIKK